MNYWLVKSEPQTYSFEDLIKDKNTVWDGIRNYQARNFLKDMRKGDNVLFYHSGKEKAVVGIAAVSKESFPEPGDNTGKWVAVEIEAVKPLSAPVSLQQIKESESLREIMLQKQSRLSVMPLTAEEYQVILEMGQQQ